MSAIGRVYENDTNTYQRLIHNSQYPDSDIRLQAVYRCPVIVIISAATEAYSRISLVPWCDKITQNCLARQNHLNTKLIQNTFSTSTKNVARFSQVVLNFGVIRPISI